MVNEKRRIFDHYKKRLMGEMGETGKTRFNVIQYLCGFPGINPFEMAAALVSEGCEIAFDDSAISQKENETYKKAVLKLVGEI